MERKKTKIVKFLETEEIKEFEKPLINEVREALNKEKMTVTDKIALRDFVVINLVYACALRISEACNLQIKDLDLKNNTLYVFNGKGGDRTVPIPLPTIELIKEWLKIRPNWKDNNYIFTNIKGTTRPGKIRPITSKYYNQLFDKLAEKTGVTLRDGSKPHPHTLRHSRAMELYDNIENIELLQKLLGHKNISTTQIYAQVRDKRIVEMQNAVTGGLIGL